jgi:hypothetical protein
MDTVRWTISTAPEIFLLLAVAIGTALDLGVGGGEVSG